MGFGAPTHDDFAEYSKSVGRKVTKKKDGSVVLDAVYGAQDIFKSKGLDPMLDPKDKIRECCDSEEHPNTIPVILALDVTGSMGSAAAEVAKKISEITVSLFNKVKDVEFMTMAIGDMSYDRVPLQASQFESDIRIAEQLDKVFFEGGGGGNGFESYTSAWYFGINNTTLDCWKRGKKGIIITLGDEALNPYLPASKIRSVIGGSVEKDVETKDLYPETIKKFDVYHLVVNDRHTCAEMYKDSIRQTWFKYLDNDHLRVVSLDTLAKTITDIVTEHQ